MKAIWNGQTLAESDDIVTVEGNAYFPGTSLNHDFFVRSTHETMCPWKGMARYYSIKVDGEINENAAWYYLEPKEAAKKIEGRVAFWKGVKIVE